MSLDKENIEWLQALSYVYIQTSRFENALTVLNMLLSENPNLPDAVKLAGHLHFLMDDYNQAFNYIKQWMSFRSTDRSEQIEMALLQARVLLRLKRKDLARKSLLRYKRLLDDEDIERKLFIEQQQARKSKQ